MNQAPTNKSSTKEKLTFFGISTELDESSPYII
jgi:hypothetical protein